MPQFNISIFKWIIFSIAISLSLVPASHAQTGGVDPEKLRTIERDVTFCVADDVELKMDIFYPNSVDGSMPTLIFVHGGGWRGGDKIRVERQPELSTLRDLGFFVVSVNYRLAPEYQFPAMIEDVKCAVRHLRANADQYGIDASRIGAWGTSAGGHLVSLLGVTDEGVFEGDGGYAEQSSRVQAVIDLYGPVDLAAMYDNRRSQQNLMNVVFNAEGPEDEMIQQASPVNHVTPDDPPFLLLHGELDETVPLSQSEIFLEVLNEVGVPASLVVVENGGHGFNDAHEIRPTTQELAEMVIDFFETHLKN